MNFCQISLALYAGAFLFLSGCTSLLHNVSHEVQPSEEPHSVMFTPQAGDESTYFYYTEAQLQWAKGNLDKAASFLEKAIRKDPESAYLKTELAMLYLQQKDEDKALSVVKTILVKKPDNVDALIIGGRISQNQNKIDEARRAYEKVIAIDPMPVIFIWVKFMFGKGICPVLKQHSGKRLKSSPTLKSPGLNSSGCINYRTGLISSKPPIRIF